MGQPPQRFILSSWPWRVWAHLLGGALTGLASLLLLAALAVSGLLLSVIGVDLVLMLAATFGVPAAAVERRRMRLVEPVPVPNPHRSLVGAGRRGRLRTRLRERATWRELGYVVVFAPLQVCVGLALAIGLTFAVILLAAPLIVWNAGPEDVMIIPGRPVESPLHALPATAAGLLALVLCAYAAGLLAGAQVKTAVFVLSPRDEERQVVELTRSRARLADAFEAERRRIERDLHDGAQAQLVALTMTLGLAELELRESGSPATELVSRARGEARLALTQLRDLVRGIYPQVLTDHGLDAAVAEIALRSPIPVDVDIDLPRRLPDAVETVAYFTVTEALTNAAKHSGATELTVVGRLKRGTLTLVITDNGRGGAVPSAGAGLQGLADRVAILKGRLVVSSPVGGPTRVGVEVPCSA
ncbi:sensor histidine kinase [Streptomyces niveus]|uniref:sensor histidine kinase n=1 Tax=Streptomyces niveus TaxID=193462 RepID=UPI002E2F147D|nr:sensor domain-containing protein [Streptomyces niveus]WTA64200.1 sensor domain-containing protein [Streptomyces niveus]